MGVKELNLLDLSGISICQRVKAGSLGIFSSTKEAESRDEKSKDAWRVA